MPGAEKFFERHPLLATMICATFAAVFGWMLSLQVREYRGFGSSPVPVAIEQTVAPAGEFAPSQWVELRGELRFDCTAVAHTSAGTLEALLFDNANETYTPAVSAGGRRVFLFVLNRAATCEDAMRHPWTGVIRAASRYDLDRVRNLGFRLRPSLAKPPMRFETYGGPRQTLKMLILTAVATALMTVGTLLFWRKYRAMERKKETAWAGTAAGR